MKEEEVLQCQVQEWYPRFKAVSIATEIHRLPESFVAYLLEDGFFVPSGGLPARLNPELPQLQAEDYDKWEEEDENDEVESKSFPELEAAIQASIERLGGAVVPKLNWSAPKDAVWISLSKNLKCSNFGEVSMLLKASDSVVHDLCHAFDNCEDKSREKPLEYVLALRKWYDLRPEMEFRAFVRGGQLVGICQREVTGFYPALLRSKGLVQAAISRFFVDKLLGGFDLQDYTFDVYVTKDMRVKLLDFNPWGGSTLPLLFSWEELEDKFQAGNENEQHHHLDKDVAAKMSRLEIVEGSGAVNHGTEIEFRVVENEGLVQPNLTATSGVPLDYIDTGPGSAWDDFLRKAEEDMKAEQQRVT